jgi:hypothetical protein
MGTLASLEEKLAALPDDTFRVFTASKEPTTETELAALDVETGIPLPRALHALLLRYGALAIEVKEEVWPRPKEFHVGPAWQFQYGVRVFGAGKGLPQELRITSSITAETKQAAVVPYFKRIGAPWLGVFTKKVVGTWAHDAFEADNGDAIDAILREIDALEDGVAKLRAEKADIETLMRTGRSLKWQAPKAGDVVDALKKQPPAALAPHLPELAKALLPPGTLSMGCLDVIEAAGAEAFPAVAKQVYAHWGKGDDPYILALLGKLKIIDTKALATYEKGLKNDGDDTVEGALTAIGGLEPKVGTTFIALLEAQVKRLEGDNLCQALGLLGQLGSQKFEALVLSAMKEMDDDDFASLVLAFEKVPKGSVAKLRAALTARFAAMDPAGPMTLGAIEGLTEAGLGDAKTMRPIIETYFLNRGPMWAERSRKVLGRLG